MSVINMAKNIKDVHPDFIVCFKVGSFYHVYGKDSYIISYLFNYNIKEAKDNIATVGFPKNALPKVISKLEKEKINYLLIDTRNNYDVDEKSDNKNLNTYAEKYNISLKYIRLKRRISRISEALILEINNANIKEKLRRIEEIVDED